MTRKCILFAIAILLGPYCFAQGVISWKEAGKYYSQQKTVEGTIVSTNNTGKVCFLNFSSDVAKDLTAVIFAADLSKFPAHPEVFYKGKRVRITGKIQKDQGKPTLIVNWPRQIVVVQKQ
jgi:hypothetical protein